MRTKLLCLVLGAAVVAGCVTGCGREKRDPSRIDKALDVIDAMYGGIPADYPDDIPVYPGLRGITAHNMEVFYSLGGGTTDSPKKVAAFYQDALPKNGWTETVPSELPDEGEYLEYTKGQRTLGVYAVTNEKHDLTHVSVSDFYEQPQ